MKFKIELPSYPTEPAYGMCGKIQEGAVNYYATVDIYSEATSKLLEPFRFFPFGTYGSPKTISTSTEAFINNEFPLNDDAWLKYKMQEWCDTAEIEYSASDSKAELFEKMLVWAKAHNYPLSA